MAIPQEILDVERPKNTRVKKSGDRYLVILRTCKRVNGKPTPVELGTIGEIINGRYVEIRKVPTKLKRQEIDIKDYGQYALCESVAQDLLGDLAMVFDIADAKKLYAIALLRAMDFSIKNRDIDLVYKTTFLSEEYPSIALSENTIATFLQDIGKAYNRIRTFMQQKVEKLYGKNIIIDGMLKDNNSYKNSFSEFSRKGRTKGSKDLNLIYAYNPETKEPIAVKPYAGNMLDMTAIGDFIDEFKIEKGLIIADKGFYYGLSTQEMRKKATNGLSYIVPLKSSSKLIKDNEMDINILKPLEGYKDALIYYKKKELEDGRFLYSYKNPKLASEQEIGYVSTQTKKSRFNEEKLKEKQSEFGVIVFESYANLSPLEIFIAYEGRWEIETMFNLFKNIIDLDTVNVHSDYSIYATEFINYLSTIITSRVKHKLKTTVLSYYKKDNKPIYISDKYSYKQVFRYLSKVKKVRVGDSNEWINCKTLGYIQDLLNSLNV